MSSIFISIISQDEEFLEQTIQSAINNSSGKNKIFFGVIDQREDGNFIDLSKYNCKYKQIVCPPRGVGIARYESMKFYNKEDFILIIDSHCTFEKFWDSKLIRRLEYISEIEGRNILISHHLSSAKIHDNKIKKCNDYKLNTSLYFDGLIIKDSYPEDKSYIEQYAVTCRFIFGYPDPFLNVPFDPRIYYLAEEVMLSIRFFTNGYRMFSIDYNPMSHLNKHFNEIKNDWRKKTDPKRMAEDFKIISECLLFKKTGKYYAYGINELEEFIDKSSIDISCVFNNLGISLTDNKKIEKVQKIIEDKFSNNNFDECLSYILRNSSRNFDDHII